MTAVLWHIELSHYKGLRYKRRVPMPGLTGPVSLAVTRGATRHMPVLQLDGRAVGGSTAIIAALEDHAPGPGAVSGRALAARRRAWRSRRCTAATAVRTSAPSLRRVWRLPRLGGWWGRVAALARLRLLRHLRRARRLPS